MAPTLPRFRSPRGQCAAAAITISTSSSASGSVQSFANTLVILSSATFPTGSVVVIVPDSSASRGGGERRSAPRHRRPPSRAPSASPTVVTAASFANRCPLTCSVLSVRSPGGGDDDDDDEEATSRPKKKYRKWGVEDERKVLDTLAKLRRDNLGVAPQASVLLQKILADGGLLRRGVDATELGDKVSKLKKKFKKTAEKLAASGRRRLRKSRDRVLYEASKEAWPDLLPGHGAAAVRLQRRGNSARVRL